MYVCIYKFISEATAQVILNSLSFIEKNKSSLINRSNYRCTILLCIAGVNCLSSRNKYYKRDYINYFFKLLIIFIFYKTIIFR